MAVEVALAVPLPLTEVVADTLLLPVVVPPGVDEEEEEDEELLDDELLEEEDLLDEDALLEEEEELLENEKLSALAWDATANAAEATTIVRMVFMGSLSWVEGIRRT